MAWYPSNANFLTTRGLEHIPGQFYGGDYAASQRLNDPSEHPVPQGLLDDLSSWTFDQTLELDSASLDNYEANAFRVAITPSPSTYESSDFQNQTREEPIENGDISRSSSRAKTKYASKNAPMLIRS
ncbi:hypothetical protein N7468_007417 [Penicillium chermesinum]|uniref:Uncharacterized protein n=1 Tax=Penicillium chermesinum TaxID=63820 RepID=A0A9W9NU74_9EURO|nr:uncharacterized protein N7468_007417 [Penicillium chermesinum]KAJ5226192.1 hypothetical protein N7468_007417 [Penicillium chermesinum]KAJ6160621.1 hypothetical protein N7470_004017 [Penicillium chermesinum]